MDRVQYEFLSDLGVLHRIAAFSRTDQINDMYTSYAIHASELWLGQGRISHLRGACYNILLSQSLSRPMET